ncbi:rhomboid family intramembrane serine protease [Abditibacterium utsteinense]|nr:rhomboid family intramembrane serine protease [Abditibacterium utsteinense]
MLFPIGDDNSDRQIKPYVTYALIALNIAVFIFLQLPSNAFTYGYSVIPAEILSGRDFLVSGRIPGTNSVIPQAPGPSPIYLTIFSAMFMHGGWAHLGGNMLYLWIFGDNVEDAMGHFKFLIFYLLCGVIATFAQIFAARAAGGLNLFIPSLGASGAIAGVLGGYLVLYPRKSVRVLIGWFGLISVPAIIVIGLWIATQVFSGVGSIFVTQQTRETGGVAYFAHIGGAVAGLILVWLFRTPRVQQRAQDHYNFGYPYNP